MLSKATSDIIILLATNNHLALRLRMSEAAPLVTHKPSRRSRDNFTFHSKLIHCENQMANSTYPSNTVTSGEDEIPKDEYDTTPLCTN
jgi:hypothetical protein